MTPAFAPFSRPLYVMAKGVGSACNMHCHYCYYLEKAQLYGGSRSTMMSDQVLETYIKQYIEAQTTPEVMFTWHGGESLLQPIAFYEKVLKYQRQYARDIKVDNAIQTNGTLITDEWARFFASNGWLVGVSIDGPASHHDRYRHMNGSGGGSHTAVLRGIDILNRHGVEWNAMAVVNDVNSREPREFYNFFKQIGAQFIQFTPIVERLRHDGRLASPRDTDCQVAPWSVDPEVWGDFLCAVFDEWLRAGDVGRVFVQLFDATLAGWLGVPPSVCSLAPECGHAAVLEYNGDLYSCDHFVFPEYKLGNIMQGSIFELMSSRRQWEFGRSKSETLPPTCLECQFKTLCNGECPKNRFPHPSNGNQPGVSYLCRGYKHFFEHSAPVMQSMAAALRSGRPASSVLYGKM